LPTHLNQKTHINTTEFYKATQIYQTSLIVLWVIFAINQSLNETFPDRLNIQKLNVFLKRLITIVFTITEQFHYMKFLTLTVPFKNNNLNLEKTYPQSLLQFHR
jgi:hypothetical protein